MTCFIPSLAQMWGTRRRPRATSLRVDFAARQGRALALPALGVCPSLPSESPQHTGTEAAKEQTLGGGASRGDSSSALTAPSPVLYMRFCTFDLSS